MKLVFSIISVLPFFVSSQTLTATFPSMAGELVRFGTFQGIQSKTLDSMHVGSNGVIKFNFNTDKPSIGYLITAENKPYFLILDKTETIRIEGERLSYPESINILEGKQNRAFSTYASEHPRREQAGAATEGKQHLARLRLQRFEDSGEPFLLPDSRPHRRLMRRFRRGAFAPR